eukprot:jgi/Tetstr1/428612/TSEL_018601.t1
MGPRVLGALLLLVFAWPFAVVWLQHSALSPDARDAVYPPRKHAPMPAIRRVDISLTSGTGEAASAGALEDVRGVAAAAVARAGRDASASPANGAPADGRQRVKAFIGVQTGFQGRVTPDTPDKYNYELRRQLLRQTWFPRDEAEMNRLLFLKGYAMRFVIGQTDDQSAEEQLRREIAAYGPMLRLNITESYEGLAWKSHHYFLMVHRYFDADYVVKIDDDVYLRPDRLMLAINQYSERKHDYIGCFKRGPIITRSNRKWFEPDHARLGDGNYFSHAYGPLYILSGRVIGMLASVPMDFLRHFMNEDVTVGGWMMLMDAKEFDDRRLCTRDCLGYSIGVYPMPTCQGLCDPVRDLPRLHGNASCRSAAVPLSYSQLPMLRASVRMNSDDR